ncbi:MAG: hypoxanthine phosphoribosyltransferase [Bacteroidota bacterium]
MKKSVKAHDLTFVPYLSGKEIAARVKKLGNQLHQDFKGKQPLFIGVLNGAFVFMSDLVRACDLPCEIAFVRLNSYAGLASSGEVTTAMSLNLDIADRHVIIVEDIVDSGRTLYQFVEDLKKMKPASVSLAVLLLKPEALEFPVEIQYLGFEIPNKFVIGYGLDFDGLGRELKGVYQLKK